ncbi:tripartite ATP-independent transporter DctM subunit [Thalassospira sp. MBR-102]|jgi:tripartite ATP-independent transporter DctM subunit|uniref:TRAP transporter large permease protein n=1 Tax=Thalassospira xiamenensis TaxID=220697 RepID=A0ABR5XWP4_9PROT|nr:MULTISPECIES: TRAP transporter large permease [Thalassospira]MBR9781113.1 TRAP transporter large permease [Rhodospirillales bacterium]KZC96848.1 C4-dicarboxylate ABC transporter [Thalassospira xiamenensis]KZD04473.1 C4-dicarboxylate ABC transporter [Thalassospira xiamenensis]MAB35362.1 TRAP transporter large permease [Thalassospira sp.]MAL30123.1 TRAP transporter large permease [Thalassospira sp.]|tara:strand:- start:286 stop:1566 length:1281 start_codon:yes stop_codon:yes gene_type:complete
MLILIAVLFTVFLVIGMPVAFALALASVPVFILTGAMPPTVVIQKMVTATQSFPLLAVPFFILAGNLMNVTGITFRLVKFARLLTGWMAGGLAQVSIVLSFMMGGISGSAVADASMEARLLGPSMIKQGYSKASTAAVLAFGSVITATIPPSIGLILFGFVNEVSIGRLFLAGVLPGIFLTIVLMITSWFVAHKNGYKPDLPKVPSGKELWSSFSESIWALAFPVILIVGFRFGLFTATEAGAFLVFYALCVGFFVYRELDRKKLYEAVTGSVSDLGMVMLLIIMAAVLGYAMTIERAPQQITEFVTTLTENPVLILTLVVAVLVISGMFLEGAANILLVTPIVMPVLVNAGYDPVHMGILIVTLINFGGLTPPVGVIMFTVCGILDVKTGAYTRASIPFFIAMVVFFVLMAAVPSLTLLLPNALM